MTTNNYNNARFTSYIDYIDKKAPADVLLFSCCMAGSFVLIQFRFWLAISDCTLSACTCGKSGCFMQPFIQYSNHRLRIVANVCKIQYQGQFGITRPLLPMVRPLLIAITHLMLVLIPSGIRAVSTHPLCLNSNARLK